MGTTKSLNSDNSVWVTTFYGGKNARCYEFTAVKEGQVGSRIFTEEEFAALMFTKEARHIRPDDGTRPEFDG